MGCTLEFNIILYTLWVKNYLSLLSAERISLLAVKCGVVSAESADWGSLMGSCAPLSKAVRPLLVCALLVLAVYEDIFL